ncbi:aminoglycoside phosphotransferase family protein [Candidatus Woesearchaeota archaeon]|nr:aminoglycoside phosphotransferase family protein [Candidatus Woesearchaeota archaeon]
MDPQTIAHHFGLFPQKISRPHHTVLSSVYLLDDAFVLRARVLHDDTVARFRQELTLCNRVKAFIPYTLPKPRIMNGRRYLITGRKLWTAYSLIPGSIVCSWQHPELATTLQNKCLMQTLRMMHDRTRGLFSAPQTRPFFLLEAEKALIDLQNDLSPSASSNLHHVLDVVKSDRLPLSQRCFVHGDFHHGNAVVNVMGKITGLLDLDWCRIGNPLEDVAYTIMMSLRDFRKPAVIDQMHLEQLQSWYGLTVSQKKMFPHYLILAAVYDASLFKHASFARHGFYFCYQLSLVELLGSFFSS